MKRLTAIESKIAVDNEVDLSSNEVRFLYELDHDIQGFGYETDPRIAEIRGRRGDRDRAGLVRLAPEIVRAQVQTAYTAYVTVAEKLHQLQTRRSLFGRKPEAAVVSLQEVEAMVAAKDAEWQANGAYEYMAEGLIRDGAGFSLIVTPNTAASEAAVVGLAQAFGKGQPGRTFIHNDLYRNGHYSSEEWSGSPSGPDGQGASVRLCLIPNRIDSQPAHKSAAKQIDLLQARRASHPRLDLRVPNLLDAVTYWHSLRARGDGLDSASTFAQTYVRHFDLRPKAVRSAEYPVVPESYIDRSGKPRLSVSDPIRSAGARLAVG